VTGVQTCALPILLSQKFAAQALPVVGAFGGASVNYVTLIGT
jgi:hypothetical protein